MSFNPRPWASLEAKYRAPLWETENCQCRFIAFTGKSNKLGAAQEFPSLSTYQMFSLVVSLPKTGDLLERKKSFVPSGEKNGTSSEASVAKAGACGGDHRPSWILMWRIEDPLFVKSTTDQYASRPSGEKVMTP
jgi:hypothetical protein